MSRATSQPTSSFTVSLARGIRTVWMNKGTYIVTFFAVFLVSFGVLFRLDFLPETPSLSATENTASVVTSLDEVSIVEAVVEAPTRIVIKKVGVDVDVLNPTQTDVPTLDNALLKGAVRYPTSVKLGEKGNMVLFGHSSYLPIVNNQNFKAFNGIEKLSKDDEILVYGEDYVYQYRVYEVRTMKSDSGVIPLVSEGKVLTLATCNSFGTPQDRYVVTATLVSSSRIVK